MGPICELHKSLVHMHDIPVRLTSILPWPVAATPTPLNPGCELHRPGNKQLHTDHSRRLNASCTIPYHLSRELVTATLADECPVPDTVTVLNCTWDDSQLLSELYFGSKLAYGPSMQDYRLTTDARLSDAHSCPEFRNMPCPI